MSSMSSILIDDGFQQARGCGPKRFLQSVNTKGRWMASVNYRSRNQEIVNKGESCLQVVHHLQVKAT